MYKKVNELKEKVERIHVETVAPNYFHHPKLDSASNLLDFAIESIDENDIEQAESSIECTIKYLDRVEKYIKNNKSSNGG